MAGGSDFDELLAILDLAHRGTHTDGSDVFTGRHPHKNPPRTFGGQMMAQAFVAASRTVRASLPPSTLSVHFIAGGDPAADLDFHVVRLRDERRFANRRVDVVQDGTLIATALVAYLSGGRGLEHGIEPPDVPDPVTLPRIDELLRGYEETVPQFVNALRPIEWRYTNDPAWVMRDKGERLSHNRVWLKTEKDMPDDPVLHTAALVYSSDTTTSGSCTPRRRRSRPSRGGWARVTSSTALDDCSPPSFRRASSSISPVRSSARWSR